MAQSTEKRTSRIAAWLSEVPDGPETPESGDSTTARVTLVRVDIPFGELMRFCTKLALASIPAVVIAGLTWMYLVAMLH